MSQTDYETELTGSREEIAAVLSGVADGLLTGAIRLGGGADAVAVDAPETLSLEIEFETEDDETSLELELEWASSEATISSPVTATAVPEEDATGEDTAAEGVAEEDTTGEEAAAEGVPEEDTTGEEAAAEDHVDTDPIPVGAADASQSLARFEVFCDRGDEWRWRLRHRNGNVIATSGQGYTRKHNAWKGLRSVMANSSDADIVDELSA